MGDETFRACDGHSIETVTMSKYVVECGQVCNLKVEFLSKFQGRGIKITRGNLICIAKPLIFFSIFRAVTR